MPPAGGPPHKLTADVRKTLVKLISDGNTNKVAAEAAGITERTLYLWLRDGKAATAGPTFQLFHALKKARAKGIAARLRRITLAGKKHWQADAWVLERTCPEHFGANRGEVQALRKQLADLLARIAELEGRLGIAQPAPAPEGL